MQGKIKGWPNGGCVQYKKRKSIKFKSKVKLPVIRYHEEVLIREFRIVCIDRVCPYDIYLWAARWSHQLFIRYMTAIARNDFIGVSTQISYFRNFNLLYDPFWKTRCACSTTHVRVYSMVLRAPWHPSDNKNKFLTIGRNTKSCLSLKYCPYQLDVTTEALSVIKIGFSISREAGLTYIYIYMYTSVYTMNVCTIISIP